MVHHSQDTMKSTVNFIFLGTTIVSHKYAPPCNLSLSTKRRVSLYAECNDFSHDYALLPVPIKHDLIDGGR